jgi:hypothetical protein
MKQFSMTYFLITLLIYLSQSVTTLFAMCADGIHTSQDYIDLARHQVGADSVCLVVDDWLHLHLTGVLIAPNKVLTAAHGVAKSSLQQSLSLKMGRLYVHFGPNSEEGVRYRVSAIHLHPEYLSAPLALKSKYDLAVLELEKPVKDIEPMAIAPSLTPKWDQDLFMVVTFGSFDWPHRSRFPKRAYVVPELEVQHLHEYDSQLLQPCQNVLLGAIFFSPERLPINQTETVIRANLAVKRWEDLGKPPYALALPGSSGSPLMRIADGKVQLVGIVTGFTHLALTQFEDPGGHEEAQFIMSQKREVIYNRYQTQFSLIYQRQDDVKLGELWSLDPGVLSIKK